PRAERAHGAPPARGAARRRPAGPRGPRPPPAHVRAGQGLLGPADGPPAPGARGGHPHARHGGPPGAAHGLPAPAGLRDPAAQPPVVDHRLAPRLRRTGPLPRLAARLAELPRAGAAGAVARHVRAGQRALPPAHAGRRPGRPARRGARPRRAAGGRHRLRVLVRVGRRRAPVGERAEPGDGAAGPVARRRPPRRAALVPRRPRGARDLPHRAAGGGAPPHARGRALPAVLLHDPAADPQRLHAGAQRAARLRRAGERPRGPRALRGGRGAVAGGAAAGRHGRVVALQRGRAGVRPGLPPAPARLRARPVRAHGGRRRRRRPVLRGRPALHRAARAPARPRARAPRPARAQGAPGHGGVHARQDLHRHPRGAAGGQARLHRHRAARRGPADLHAAPAALGPPPGARAARRGPGGQRRTGGGHAARATV
ncbi:MAG: hypothetical protein AVDCRST_MAG13-1650, partial [uncultured Solirubrobacteraceae bacterium]